jgi:hypothetical protein
VWRLGIVLRRFVSVMNLPASDSRPAGTYIGLTSDVGVLSNFYVQVDVDWNIRDGLSGKGTIGLEVPVKELLV